MHTRFAQLRERSEVGSAAAEFVIVAPLMVLVLLLVVASSRLAGNRQELHDAAHQAARAASTTRDPASAQRRAGDIARAALSSAGVSCQRVTVVTDVSRFRPGGTVHVQVSCEVALHGLVPGMPGSRRLSASATSPVDAYRGAVGIASGQPGDSR
ncbi:TadE/TadG family type IV pilus assembly protein [Yinghuangia soli]|nr:TadE/TadG family type IV pilus assembly protein [Yinghuangia soli]